MYGYYLTTFTINLEPNVGKYTSPMDPSWVKLYDDICVLVES